MSFGNGNVGILTFVGDLVDRHEECHLVIRPIPKKLKDAVLNGRAHGRDRRESFAVLAEALAPELDKPRAQQLEAGRVWHADMDRPLPCVADEFVGQDKKRVFLAGSFLDVITNLFGAFEKARDVKSPRALPRKGLRARKC